MFISVLLLLWGLSKCAGDSCEISSFNFHCSNITQESFFRYSFKNEDELKKDDIKTIEITNSNFTVIEFFPRPIPFSRQNTKIKNLKLIESRIENISDNAFTEWGSLQFLNLSRNKIYNTSFLKHLPNSISKVDLSYNELTVLDLTFVEIRKIFFSHNKIHSLKRLSGYRYDFDLIDLSYNNLVNFNEWNIDSISTSLDLSYNQLKKVLLVSAFNIKDTVNLMGNNISSLGPYNKTAFRCKTLSAANIPTDTFVEIENSLMMNGSKIGILDKHVFDSRKLITHYYFSVIINLSNSSINAISEYFFTNIEVSEINLSYNNISSLQEPIFNNSQVTVINLAHSGIRNISERTFKGVRKCNEIILKGNFLRVVDNICTGSSIKTIDFSYNKIEKIKVDTLYGCNQLKSLDLSFNFIHYFEPGTFQSLNALQVLDLSENNITFGNTTISNLSRIEAINLSNNNMEVIGTNALTNLSLSYLEINSSSVKIVKTKAFNKLYRLRVLNLSKTGIEVLERNAFFELPSIQTIHLTDNKLSTIVSYTFSNIPVSEILLKGNQIFTLKTRAFNSLRNLANLDLSRQKITEIEPFSFSNSSIGNLDLRYNKITYIGGHIFDNVSIERLYINENNVTKLSPFGNDVKIRELSLELRGILDKGTISNMYLEKLLLTNSYVGVMKNGSFEGSYNLNKLTFENTTIISYEPEVLRNLFNLKDVDIPNLIRNERKLKQRMFMDIMRLEKINLHHLGLTEIGNYTFIGLARLKKLSLLGNRITTVSMTSFSGLEQLLLLDLSANEFISVNLAFLKTLPNLYTLNLSRNKIKYISCYSKNDEIYNNLTTLYLNQNNFSHITPETFSKLYKLKDLYLNDNIITHIDSNAFAQLENLKYLNLENNLIRKVLPDTFKCQRRLESLYLGNNSIEDIPLNTFQHLKALEELYLDHNHLFPFRSGVFNGPQNLVILNVSHNNPMAITSLNFTPLKSLSKLIHMNLDGYRLEDDFDYLNIRINFPYLKTIKINHNNFSCQKLLDILKYFNKIEIEYTPEKPEYDRSNYFGIQCYDAYTEEMPTLS